MKKENGNWRAEVKKSKKTVCFICKREIDLRKERETVVKVDGKLVHIRHHGVEELIGKEE